MSSILSTSLIAKLSSSQLESLELMRKTFNNNNNNDINQPTSFVFNDELYLRYLRARNYDFNKSSEMLKETIKWRQSFGLDKLNSDEYRSCVSKENISGKMYLRGYDKDGSVLLYMRPRCENTHNHENNVKHLVFNLEKAIACLDSKGENVEKWSIVIDFQGYSMFNAPPMKTSMETLNILQNHYPERLKKAFCIRPPFIFNAFWSMISPFIDPVTKDKIIMVNDPVQKTLEKYIDLSRLETEIGGSDERLFDSSKYLSADFGVDYLTIIDDAEKKDQSIKG